MTGIHRIVEARGLERRFRGHRLRSHEARGAIEVGSVDAIRRHACIGEEANSNLHQSRFRADQESDPGPVSRRRSQVSPRRARLAGRVYRCANLDHPACGGPDDASGNEIVEHSRGRRRDSNCPNWRKWDWHSGLAIAVRLVYIWIAGVGSGR